ncbi:Pilus assembly protein, PilP [compost metagenome]
MIRHRILLLAWPILLVGCGQEDSLSDLRAWVSEAQVQPGGLIEPLPEIARAEPFTYAAAALRSPFQKTMQDRPADDGKLAVGIAPDPDRTRQFLESLSLEQFEMVGTIANRTGFFALLRGAGTVYRVQVGDYLGRNEGQVVAISESRVDLVEVVSDGGGGWRKRPRNISLK